MNKRQKNIISWIVVWAGLLMAVLYSPVGSPGLYSSQNQYAGNQYIATKPGAILNAPAKNSTQEFNDPVPNLPEISTASKTTYTTGNYNSSIDVSHGSYSGMQNSSYQTNNTSRGESGGNGTAIIQGRSSHTSDGSSAIAMTNGLTTISLTSELNSSNKQSVTAVTPVTGGTDPGGDPTGDPIPVSDGWGVLVLFGLVYACLKIKFFS